MSLCRLWQVADMARAKGSFETDRVAALVEPGEELSNDELARYSRHLLLPELGVEGQRRLKAARVLVMGAGGLGAPVLTYLAAAGVGTISVVDDDVVDVSNLQRQVIFGERDLGRPKVEAAADRLREINPHVAVVGHHVRADSTNILDLISGHDLVIDGTDNFATRYLVNDACVISGAPYVWGSVFRFEGQVSVFWDRHGPQYRDLYPEAPPAGLVPSCAEGGVLGALCAMVGATMASEALKLITGVGDPLIGRLLVLDALSMRWRDFAIDRDPQTVRVTSLDPAAYLEVCEVPSADTGSVTVAELRRLLDEAGREVLLIDVREPFEHALGAIPGSELVPRGELTAGELKQRVQHNPNVVLYCKSGVRSRRALERLRSEGLTHLRSLEGGFDAWSGVPVR